MTYAINLRFIKRISGFTFTKSLQQVQTSVARLPWIYLSPFFSRVRLKFEISP